MTGREHLNIAAAEARGYRRAVDNLTGGAIFDIIREYAYLGSQLEERDAAALASRLLVGLTEHLNDLGARPS